MQERKRIVYIILVMSVVVLCVGVFANVLLYRTSFERTRDNLGDTVKVLAHIIESQSFPERGVVMDVGSEGCYARLSGTLNDAVMQYERHNRSMELTVARRKADKIHFLAALRQPMKSDVPNTVGMYSGLAEPMRKALEGKSGTMVGKDYYGNTVLAAYDHVPRLGLGIVAKVDLSKIRAPFIRAGLIVIAFSIMIIAIGITAISRISHPIIESLEKRTESLAETNEDLSRANEELTATNEELDAANEELQAAMEEMEQTNEQLLHSQDELDRSETRVRTLLDSSPAGILTADRETRRFVYANPSACKMFGYNCDEMVALGINDIHPPEDLERVHAEFQSLLNRDFLTSRDLPCLRKDGSVFYADISAEPINYDGRPCLLGQFVDVTERKQAEEALRKSEEKFFRAFMNAPVLMSITGIEDGTIIEVNDQFVRQSGFSREELIGRRVTDVGFVRPGDRGRYLDKVRQGGAATSVELTVYPKEGGSRQVIFSGDNITIKGKRILIATAVDITDLKRAEEELRAQKELAQKYLDVAGVMMVAIGADQSVTMVNRKGCEILGYQAEQIVGRNWFDTCVPEKGRETVKSVFSQIMMGEIASAEYFENTVLTSSGEERLVAWHNTLVRDASGAVTGTLSSGEDITERRKSEEELHNQLALNMALAGISGSIISRSFTVPETAYMVLEYARLLSDSEYGFVSEIDPDTGDNIGHAMTKMADWWPSGDNEGAVVFKKGADGLYPGLWGHALNTRREFFTNDPDSHPASKKLPEGHGRITRFLSVPVLFGSSLVGQIALADSMRDYTLEDLKMARRLGSIYAMAVVRFRDESMLMKSLEEKTVLIKELHHRVKNNMQVVSSLISLQARKIDNEKFRGIFMESSHRIQAMALVHEKMYHSGDMARIDFSRYVREIAERLHYSFSLEPGQVDLDVNVRDIFLGIDEAVPCGIIVNELITNAFKHAFRNGRRGKLSISFMKQDDGRRRLVVGDDGPGTPGDIINSAEQSLGIQIVTALTRQLNGTISINGGQGTRVELVF